MSSQTTTKKPPLIVRFFKALIPWKGDKASEVVRKLIFLIALIVFIGAVAYIGNYYYVRWNSQQLAERVAALYVPSDENMIDQNPSDPETPAAEGEEPAQEEQPPVQLPSGYSQDFAKLYAINPDVKGFISIDNTNIAFPVMQGEDNDEYLYHNIYKNYDVFGVPFLDYRCTLEQDAISENLVIYGHHMNGKRVFGQLVNYKDLNFYKKHPIVHFNTVYQQSDWKIVSVFMTNTNPDHDNGNVFDYWNYIDMDEERFNSYVEEVKKRSYIDTGIDAEYGDQLISLSTCSYEIKDARTVLVARRVRDGETSDVDVNAAKVNSDAYYPQAYRG